MHTPIANPTTGLSRKAAPLLASSDLCSCNFSESPRRSTPFELRYWSCDSASSPSCCCLSTDLRTPLMFVHVVHVMTSCVTFSFSLMCEHIWRTQAVSKHKSGAERRASTAEKETDRATNRQNAIPVQNVLFASGHRQGIHRPFTKLIRSSGDCEFKHINGVWSRVHEND